MYNLRINVISALFISFAFGQTGLAATETVKWTGVLQEERGYHTPNHNNGHELEFVRQDDKKSFDVVDSDNLLALHAEKDKNLLVEVEGELTPQFLFWGGNLKVKSFKVLSELDEIQHRDPPKRLRTQREFGGGLRGRL